MNEFLINSDRCIGWLRWLCFLLFVTSTAFAQSSLDDQLFEDLRDPPQTQKRPQVRRDADQVTRRQFERQLQKELGGEDVGKAGENPLTRTAEMMRQVRDRLAVKDTAAETRQMQQTILQSLDKLIEKLNNQQSKPSGGGEQPDQQKPKPAPSQPSPQSGSSPPQNSKQSGQQSGAPQTANGGVSQSGVATRDQLMQQSWGKLPAKVRQEMQSARPEKFLPKYERLIEQYFQRLSESEE